MNIHPTDAPLLQRSGFSQAEHFRIFRLARLRQIPEQAEHFGASDQISAGQLTNHEWVAQHLAGIQ